MLGIGDDAAVLKISPQYYQIFTHDLCLEKVHFLAESKQALADAGWKALAVNLSDVAAMGGEPVGAVVGLGIPKKASLAEVEAVSRGLRQCAKKYQCPLVGGDTNASSSGWVLAVTVLGKCSQAPKLRSGAKVGDTLWVTGEVGSAALGWELQRRGVSTSAGKVFRAKHARPEPRLSWGKKLRSASWVSAMMDVSDGLAGDLKRLKEASGVGFRVDLDKLPRRRGFSSLAKQLGLQEYNLLLGGGEDYELLFTVAARKNKLATAWFQRNQIKATCIGEVVKRQKISFFQKGKEFLKEVKGFTHF